MKSAPGPMMTMLRLGFIATMIAAFSIAISPLAVDTGIDNGDKIAHVLAFYSLTVFAAISFPRTSPLAIAVGMSAYGALIEVVQGLPLIGRDRDIADWIADTAAVLAALAPLYVARWRAKPI